MKHLGLCCLVIFLLGTRWHKGVFTKLNWNQQVTVWPALVRNDLLGINLVYLDCFFWLVHKYLWQAGLKPIVTELLWHCGIIYVSEFRSLKYRFYFTNKNASVALCWMGILLLRSPTFTGNCSNWGRIQGPKRRGKGKSVCTEGHQGSFKRGFWSLTFLRISFYRKRLWMKNPQ